jgi:hypothetical protein
MTKEDIQILKSIIKIMEKVTYKEMGLVEVMQASASLRAFADLIKRAEMPIIEQPKTELKSGRNKR